MWLRRKFHSLVDLRRLLIYNINMTKKFQTPTPEYHTIPEPNDIFNNILADHFKGYTGRFLGIGANVGLDWGFPLLDRGWSGIYCEPDPIACSQLIQNTEKYRDRVSVVNSAIMPTGGLRPFYLSLNSSFLSSMHSDWLETVLSYNNNQWDQNPKKVSILTNSISFQEFINYIGKDFDLIVIDTEGFDVEIAMSVDWSQFTKCTLISLEHGFPEVYPSSDIIEQLYNQGSFILTTVTPGHAVYKKII